MNKFFQSNFISPVLYKSFLTALSDFCVQCRYLKPCMTCFPYSLIYGTTVLKFPGTCAH